MQDTGKTLLQPKGSRNIVEIVYYACLYFRYEMCGRKCGERSILCGEWIIVRQNGCEGRSPVMTFDRGQDPIIVRRMCSESVGNGINMQ